MRERGKEKQGEKERKIGVKRLFIRIIAITTFVFDLIITDSFKKEKGRHAPAQPTGLKKKKKGKKLQLYTAFISG